MTSCPSLSADGSRPDSWKTGPFSNVIRSFLGRNGLPVELHRSPAARTYRAQEIETGRRSRSALDSPAPSHAAVLKRLEAEAIAAEEVNPSTSLGYLISAPEMMS